MMRSILNFDSMSFALNVFNTFHTKYLGYEILHCGAKWYETSYFQHREKSRRLL